MVNQPELGKKTISKSIADLKSLSESRPNSFVLQLFFDTKSDEVVQIFSGGPSFDTSQLREDLNRVAPFFSAKWDEIR